jgi:hypothetical protein
MRRYFNTAGPCQAEKHYIIPPERRLSGVRKLIDQALFFVLYAPRRTGKTTLLNTLARSLNQEGSYTAFVIDVEFIQGTTAAETGNLALIERIHRHSAATLPDVEQAPDPSPVWGSRRAIWCSLILFQDGPGRRRSTSKRARDPRGSGSTSLAPRPLRHGSLVPGFSLFRIIGFFVIE